LVLFFLRAPVNAQLVISLFCRELEFLTTWSALPLPRDLSLKQNNGSVCGKYLKIAAGWNQEPFVPKLTL